jgi:ABC-2 type transport system ATP-binding protein
MNPSATVELTRVTKRYRGTTALDAIDLSLRPGITGLLGPNGAGKTTLLRILATVLAHDTGDVRVLGRVPSASVPLAEIRRRLGYLPQEMGFPRSFSCFAFVDYMAVLKEWSSSAPRHEEVRRVLDLVDLADVAPKRIRALSGGQRRRVGLAQALLGAPELLLLDEPTTGVDPEQRVSLRQLLSAAGERSTVLLSTHQTEDVAALCDRVVVLDHGRILHDGGVRELVAMAAGRVWLADAPDPDARASWRTGTGKYRNVGAVAPDGSERTEPTLEDAYLLLLGSRVPVTEVAA